MSQCERSDKLGDTPRTNAEVERQILATPRHDKGGEAWYMMRDFAHQLERELAQAHRNTARVMAHATMSTPSSTAPSFPQMHLHQIERDRLVLKLLDEVDAMRRGSGTTYPEGQDPVAELRHLTPKSAQLDGAEQAARKALAVVEATPSATSFASEGFVMGQLDKDINDAIDGLPAIWRPGFRDRFARLLRKAIKLLSRDDISRSHE